MENKSENSEKTTLNIPSSFGVYLERYTSETSMKVLNLLDGKNAVVFMDDDGRISFQTAKSSFAVNYEGAFLRGQITDEELQNIQEVINESDWKSLLTQRIAEDKK